MCFGNTKPEWDKLHGGTGGSGAFLFNSKEDADDNSGNQSRVFRNLKSNIKIHFDRKIHQQKKQILSTKEKELNNKLSRKESIGKNIFRIRYNGIKQGKTRVNFEEDILTAKLNKVDVGDVNHSRKFAEKLDDAIYTAMKAELKEHMDNKLDATEQKRPAGLIMDKMTPRRRTGQIHGIVIPVPENPLTQDLLVPLMLEVPPTTDLSAEGLAKLAKEVFNNAGFSDERLEGVGWDGEYEKKGVKRKLLDVPGRTADELSEWITSRWEPAHQLELATKDVKKESHFDWFEEHIKVVYDTYDTYDTNVLNIGKGLEQSLEASEEVGEKFYKLKTLSDTRFSAYFEAVLKAFEKRINTTIEALKKRQLSKDKEVKDKATWLLKRILSKKFFLINLCLIDIYRVLGSFSSSLQTVEQFPWEIEGKQLQLIKTLKKMSDLKLTVDDDEGDAEPEEVDQSLWPCLGPHLESVLQDEYVRTDTSLFGSNRRGRTGADIPANLDVLTTVQNRITSLCRSLVKNLERRLKETPTPKVIQYCSDCLDMNDIIENMEDEDVREKRATAMIKLVSKADYDTETSSRIIEEYELFKQRLNEVAEGRGESVEVVKRFEHLIFVCHTCSSDCPDRCPDKFQPLPSRILRPFKVLHLFLKEPVLYSGIEAFLHLYLRYLVKTHAEGVVESMGNIVEIHSDTRRGKMELEDVGKEALIHWNGPPVSSADKLGVAALNIVFGGRQWNFVTWANKSDSVVTKRLKNVEPKVPFFS